MVSITITAVGSKAHHHIKVTSMTVTSIQSIRVNLWDGITVSNLQLFGGMKLGVEARSRNDKVIPLAGRHWDSS
jgi:hypothetical protein